MYEDACCDCVVNDFSSCGTEHDPKTLACFFNYLLVITCKQGAYTGQGGSWCDLWYVFDFTVSEVAQRFQARESDRVYTQPHPCHLSTYLHVCEAQGRRFRNTHIDHADVFQELRADCIFALHHVFQYVDEACFLHHFFREELASMDNVRQQLEDAVQCLDVFAVLTDNLLHEDVEFHEQGTFAVLEIFVKLVLVDLSVWERADKHVLDSQFTVSGQVDRNPKSFESDEPIIFGVFNTRQDLIDHWHDLRLYEEFSQLHIKVLPREHLPDGSDQCKLVHGCGELRVAEAVDSLIYRVDL